jgi:hypothetical protein
LRPDRRRDRVRRSEETDVCVSLLNESGDRDLVGDRCELHDETLVLIEAELTGDQVVEGKQRVRHRGGQRQLGRFVCLGLAGARCLVAITAAGREDRG